MKRDCKYETWLPDYTEGTLDETRTDTLEDHLADCSVCLETASLLTVLARQDEGLDLDPVPAAAHAVRPDFFVQGRKSGLGHGASGRKAQAMGHLALGASGPSLTDPGSFPRPEARNCLVRERSCASRRLFKGMPVEIESRRRDMGPPSCVSCFRIRPPGGETPG